MKKLILLFGLLVAISVSFNLASCSKDESDIENYDYSTWADLTDADSVIYAKARAAYLEDPANKGKAEYMVIQFLSQNPFAVRTKAVENGTNYQFACFDNYVVTVYKGTSDKVGKVIEIMEGSLVGDGGFPGPIPPNPKKRDTIIS